MRMTRLLWILALLSMGDVRAAEYSPVHVVLRPIQVSAHAYYVQGQAGVASAANEGYTANAGFVVTNDGVVVIDALGTPSLGRELIRVIRDITKEPIKRVILTHYHADHFYGLQAFKELGADIWAQRGALEYLNGGEAEKRLAERKKDLAPWINNETRVVRPDQWIDEEKQFALGGLHFDLIHIGPAHSPEDLVIVVKEDRVVFSGDIMFTGRIPFVGKADSGKWLAAIDRLLRLDAQVMIPGHGAASRDPGTDLAMTRDYLTYLRAQMRVAVADFVPFDEAYAKTDWTRFSNLPAFAAANRLNAYGTYLLLENESLNDQKRESSAK